MGLLSRPCRKRRASFRDDGGISWFLSSCGTMCGVSLELWQDSGVRRGTQGASRVAKGSPFSNRVAKGSWGLLSSHCRAHRPHLVLCPETPCSSPGATGILGLHLRLTRGVRPRLKWKQRTLLTSRVATGTSWSPLSGLKGVKSPVGFSKGLVIAL